MPAPGSRTARASRTARTAAPGADPSRIHAATVRIERAELLAAELGHRYANARAIFALSPTAGNATRRARAAAAFYRARSVVLAARRDYVRLLRLIRAAAAAG